MRLLKAANHPRPLTQFSPREEAGRGKDGLHFGANPLGGKDMTDSFIHSLEIAHDARLTPWQLPIVEHRLTQLEGTVPGAPE